MLRNAELFAAVLAEPDDDAPRLVYADWLQERADPRGEMITLSVEHARIPKTDPRSAEIAARLSALWSAHFDEWRPRTSRDLQLEVKRGFIESLRGTPAQLQRALADHEALSEACVRELNVQARSANTSDMVDVLAWLARMPQLRALRMWEVRPTTYELETLAQLPTLTHLRKVVANGAHFEPAGLAALGRLPAIRALALQSCSIAGGALAALGDSGCHLKELRVTNFETPLDGTPHPFARPAFAHLERLELTGIGLRAADLDVALAQRHRLVELTLSQNALGPDVAHDLATRPELAQLEHLGLAHCGIGLTGLRRLLQSTTLPRGMTLALEGELLGLTPDIWYDGYGAAIGASWVGEPTPELRDRFTIRVEGHPELPR